MLLLLLFMMMFILYLRETWISEYSCVDTDDDNDTPQMNI